MLLIIKMLFFQFIFLINFLYFIFPPLPPPTFIILFILSSPLSMQVVRSFKIHLTLDDIIETVPQCTKEQLVRNFKLLLDRKQIEINDKIQKLNAQHLLILQKKVLVVQKKDEQIVKLNNTITIYKNEIYEEKMKFSQLSDELFDVKYKATILEKKLEETESIFKDESAKKEKLRQEVEELRKINFSYEKQIRDYKKLKDEKSLWGMETNILLTSMNQRHLENMNEKVNYLELDLKNKESVFKERTDTLRKKNEQMKKLYTTALKTIEKLEKQRELEKSKQKVQTFHRQIQTEEEYAAKEGKKEIYFNLKNQDRDGVETAEKGVQAQIEGEKQLINLKNYIKQNSSKVSKQSQRKIEKIDKQIQTQAQTGPQKQSLATQTDSFYNFSGNGGRDQFFQPIPQNSQMKIKSLAFKCREMEELLRKRPSRQEDLEEMRALQSQIVKIKLLVLQKEEELQNCKILMNQLRRSQNSPTCQLKISPEKRCRRYSTNSTNFKIKPCTSQSEKVKSKSMALIVMDESQNNEECQDEKLKQILLQKGIKFKERGIKEHKRNQEYRKFKSMTAKRVESIRKTTI